MATAVLAVAVAGCGPAAPNSSPSADPAATLLAQARAATVAASSYRAAGMFTDTLSGDAVITPSSAEGTLSEAGETWRFRAVGGTVYFQGAALWQHTQPPAVAARLGDAWVRMDGTPDYWGTVRFARSLDTAVTTLVLGEHPGLGDHGIRTESGVQVHDLESGTDLYYIDTEAPHYPYRWVDLAESSRTGDSCGLTFSNFDAPVTITAPPDAVSFAASGALPGPSLATPSPSPAGS